MPRESSKVIVIMWRDIPAQIIVAEPSTAKVVLGKP